MIDHLMRFETEAAAKADPVVGTYWRDGVGEFPGAWDASRCIAGVSVYSVSGTEMVEIDGPNGPIQIEREIRVPYSGWFINITLSELSVPLRSVEGNACRLIADRVAASLGQQFLLYVAPDMDQETLGAAKVEPTFAGSNYPFGAV